jgi:hypothetical protein
MKRTIVALAALGMLATAGSARAGGFSNYSLFGTYVETFQGATSAPAPITGICQLTFDGAGHLVLGSLANPASYCFTDNGSSGGCDQNFASGSYGVNSDGTGSITGTLTSGAGCTSTTFSEALVIQQISRSVAQNVVVTRTDAGAFAAGSLVPEASPSTPGFFQSAIYGDYAEVLGGTLGSDVFGGVCNDFFNGSGDVSGKCTLNIAGSGKCQYNLSGNYFVFNGGTFGPGGGIIYSATLSGGSCTSITFGEFLKVVNGSGYGAAFTADEIAAVSYEGGTVSAGTYQLQN